jgi:hypothetical protein
MNSHPQALTPAVPVSGQAPVVRTPEEQQARAQAKALKKEKKNERLRFFYGWCEGCQAFGSGF